MRRLKIHPLLKKFEKSLTTVKFNYNIILVLIILAKGKIQFPPSAWNQLTDITSSAEGAGGVFFVNVPQAGGTVVVKGSPDIVKVSGRLEQTCTDFKFPN